MRRRVPKREILARLEAVEAQLAQRTPAAIAGQQALPAELFQDAHQLADDTRQTGPMSTGNHIDGQRHLNAAMDHAVHGRKAAALAELAAITRQGPHHEYMLWRALADTTLHPLRQKTTPGGEQYGMSVFQPYVGPDNAPPAVRLAVKFLTAAARRDPDDLRDVFNTAHADGPEMAGEVLGWLLEAAAESARAQLAEQAVRDASRPGRPGAG